MKMKKRIISLFAVLALLLTAAAPVSADNAENTEMSYIVNIMGRSNALEYNETEGIGWENVNVDWSLAEPSRSSIDTNYISELHSTIKNIQKQGKKTMLTIENPPVWAVNKSDLSFDRDDGTYTLSAYIGIKYGKMLRNLTHPDGTTEEIMADTLQLPVSQSAYSSWTSFVESMAKEFKDDGIEYVQVNSNPFGSVNEYYGGAEDYFVNIHKPAAEILHKYGYKVVCGGVSTGFGVTRILDLLDRQNGYDTIDVFNLTYNTLGAVNYLYNELKTRGIDNPSIWLTAVGYENSGVYTPNLYPRFFRWIIDVRDSSNPDQFKIFWSERAQDGKEIPLSNEEGQTIYGKEIAALARLLDGKTVDKFESFEFSARLNFHIFDNMSSAEGFIMDSGRVVIAAHFLKQNTAAIFSTDDGDTMHVNFSNSYVSANISGIPENSVVKRTTITGTQWEVNKKWDENGDMFMDVAVPDKISAPASNINETAEAIAANSGFMTTFFIEIVPPEETQQERKDL